MTKIKSIPSIQKGMLANREQERDSTKAMNGLRKVKLSKITVRAGFNLRETFEEIDILADSIEAMGLQQPLKVDLLADGTAVLLDGERRYKALMLLSSKSAELKKKYEDVPAIVNTKDISETDRLVIMLTTQAAHTFSALEVAEGYRRLRDGHLGEPAMTITQIAAKVGQSAPYVDSKLILADATPEEKELVRANRVSATALVSLTRQEDSSEKRVTTIKNKNNKGQKYKVRDSKSSPAVTLCMDALEKLDDALDILNPQGAGKNSILEAQSKIRAIIQIIQ